MAYRSSGTDNAELVHNLRAYGIVESERVFGALLEVDRGDFVPDEFRREAYLDQPLLAGRVHMSAPHIYGTVLEALDLRPGQSFLNVGSGTGYLSTVAGRLLGGRGVNHGVEIEAEVVAHAQARHGRYLERHNDSSITSSSSSSSSSSNNNNSSSRSGKKGVPTVTPASFFVGNVFELEEQRSMRYDRIYVGAECPPVVKEKLMSLLLPRGGVLVGPMGDELVRITRRGGPEQRLQPQEAAAAKEGGNDYEAEFLCAVRFAPLKTKPSALPPGAGGLAAAAAVPNMAAAGNGNGPFGNNNANGGHEGEASDTVSSISSSGSISRSSSNGGGTRSRTGSFCLPPPVWSPALHYSYPLHFRLSAQALLLCSARRGTPLHGLPPALLQEVLAFADRMWFEPPPAAPKDDGDGNNGVGAGLAAVASGLKRKLSSASSSLLRGMLFRSSSSHSNASNASAAAGGGGPGVGAGSGHGDDDDDGEPPSYHAMLALSSLMQSAQGWGAHDGDDDDTEEDEEEGAAAMDTSSSSSSSSTSAVAAAFPAPPARSNGNGSGSGSDMRAALAALLMGLPPSAFHGEDGDGEGGNDNEHGHGQGQGQGPGAGADEGAAWREAVRHLQQQAQAQAQAQQGPGGHVHHSFHPHTAVAAAAGSGSGSGGGGGGGGPVAASSAAASASSASAGAGGLHYAAAAVAAAAVGGIAGHGGGR